MLTSSQDIFLVVAAFCLLWLTCLISLGIYYLVMMLRDVRAIFTDAKRRIEAIDSFARSFADKLDHTTNSFSLLMEGFNRFSNYFQEKRGAKRGRKKGE